MSSQELPSQQQPALISSDAPLPSSPTPASTGQAQAQSNSAVPATSQEPKPAQAPNSRVPALQAKQAALQSKLADLQAQRTAYIEKATLPSGLAMPEDWNEEERAKQALATANGVIKEHITALHRYNETKDIGLGLMGLVAEGRGVRQKIVMEEFGIGEKD
ncbi:hypothetical protein CBER1_06000 [Cercospora berteroae]|uniref:Swi5-domain-containing protein n=1 Tax=Cercospora berteroae TaxID=357750 RepID=A0A2S6C4L5_9PEZI|nr:hypothetical protein CBER1_06000 [Cercospora berteroae]